MDKIAYINKLERVKSLIRSFFDFPKDGIIFRDMMPVFQDPQCFSDLIYIMCDSIKNTYTDVDYIVGLEARGFLIGPSLALRLNIGFVPIRKSGKLPGKTEKVTYSLEYGEDALEIQADAIKPGQKVIIVDDLLATGGTATAACTLVERVGAVVLECMVVMELFELKGRQTVPCKITSLIQY